MSFPIPHTPAPVGAPTLSHRDFRGEAVRRIQEAAAKANPQRKPDPMIAGEPLAGQDAADKLHAADPIFLASQSQTWMWWGPPPPVEGNVAIDGVDSFRLVTAHPDARPGHISLNLFAAIVEKIGVPFRDETSTLATARGVAELVEMRTRAPESAGLAARLGQPDAHVWQMESRGLAWGIPTEVIEQHTGRPLDRSRKYVFDACEFVRPIEREQERQKAAGEKLAAEQRARVEAENTPNKRTLREVGIGLAIKSRVGDPFVGTSRALGFLPGVCLENFPGGASYEIRASRGLEGLEVPPCTINGHEVLPHGYVIPVAPARMLDQVPEPTGEVVDLMIAIRKRVLPNSDRGPIDASRFQPPGDEARALVERYVREAYVLGPGRGWVAEYLCHAVVRGCLVESIEATALIWRGLLDVHAAHHGAPKMRVAGAVGIGKSDRDAAFRPRISEGVKRKLAPKITGADVVAREDVLDLGTHLEIDPTASTLPPYSGATNQAEIGKWCIEAAAGGEITPGALLPSSPSKSKKVSK